MAKPSFRRGHGNDRLFCRSTPLTVKAIEILYLLLQRAGMAIENDVAPQGREMHPNSSNPTNDDSHLSQQWNELDHEYRQLTTQQERLEWWLQDLKQEEEALQQALNQVAAASDADTQRKPLHQQAIDRLTEALMNDDDDNDDDGDDTDDTGGRMDTVVILTI
jgi:hypothetical protein